MPINGFPGQVISATAPTVSTAGATGIWGLDEQLQYAGQNLWPGYQISRSVRLRSSASAYFNRTPASASNRTTWTWSGWAKIGTIGTAKTFFDACNTDENNEFVFQINTSNVLVIQQTVGGTASGQISCTTNAVFRDPSAWYHLVLSVDTGNATSTNRIRVFVNGVQQTFATYTANSVNTWINFNSSHTIGRQAPPNSGFFDGYLTEINFIDGQALDPSSFGVTSAATGVWGPIKYTGTYGYNGYYLNFSDNSAATAAAIGKDSSGNGNNWTPNNISVTAGATYDSMVDVPVQYGGDTGVGAEVRGNYAVFNAIAKASSQPTFSNGNLDLSASAAWNGAIGTIGITSGKWYWEVVCGNSDSFIGICGDNLVLTTADPQTLTGTILYYGASGQKRVDGTLTAYGASYTTETIGVALDIDGGTVTFYKSNSSQGSISLSSSTLNGRTIFPFIAKYASTANINFGQRAFSYTAPSGYKALCTANITAPTIPNGASYMAATTYAGSGASQSFTNTVNSVSFQPDLVWVKNRSSATNHYLWDSVRGALKEIYSNLTNAESTNTIGLSAFNSNGFTLNNGDSAWNASGSTYVGWNWKAGGTAVTNNDGNRTASVSANTTAGFSVVTYTFSTSATNTIGHGLGVAPSMIIMKNRTQAYNWEVYHVSLGYTQRLILNSTGAATASYWAATPTSTVFSVTTSDALNNDNLVAYCFAPIAGYSAFGSYTGNGAADGTFVYTGFRPRYLMIKRTDNVGSWWMIDTSRSPYNVSVQYLFADTTAAEGSDNAIDILSNGFKLRVATYQPNTSGGTFIYAAFAENPFKFSLAR